MKRTLQLKLRSEKGVTLVFVTIFLVALFGFAALSIDVGQVLQQQRKVHHGTDAGSLAGVEFARTFPQSKSAILAEAEAISLANTVTADELAYGGGIEAGRWNETDGFVADATPYNAVRVGAQRVVDLAFARVVGMSQMRPTVHSVAVVAGANNANGIPVAITEEQLAGKNYGDVIDISVISPGNWQKIDVCGMTMSGMPDFTSAMVNDTPCELHVGESVTTATGDAGWQQNANNAWNKRLAAGKEYACMPVVDRFDTGSSYNPVILGLIRVKLLTQSGPGSQWSGQVEFVDGSCGTGIGGPDGAPWALNRVLVE